MILQKLLSFFDELFVSGVSALFYVTILFVFDKFVNSLVMNKIILPGIVFLYNEELPFDLIYCEMDLLFV